MTPPPESSWDGDRLRAAAFRLKHDLGKSIRWNAPRLRERDSEALRRRLAADLLETRKGPDGTRGAVEIFDAWRREEGEQFLGVQAWAQRLARITDAIESVRRRARHLSELPLAELEILDRATQVLQEESRGLYRDVVGLLGPPRSGKP